MRPTPTAAPRPRTAQGPTRSTRALLLGGAAAGPLFVLTILGQALGRDGYDAARHPLSMLALGPHGWIQTVNFLLAGALVLASVIGLRHVLDPGSPGRTWGTALIALYGTSLIWAGVFPADPAEGFPSGTPAGPAEPSWHGMLHNLAPVGMSLALSAACLVFARRFARQGDTGWMIYSTAAPVASFALSFAAVPAGDFRLMLAGGAVIWTWAAALCLRLLIRQARRA